MEKIDINDLTIDKSFKSGSYANVHKCLFNNKLYAYKEFKNGKYPTNLTIKKMNYLNSIDNDKIITPKFIVFKNGNRISYLTDFVDGKCIMNCQSKKKKIMALKQAKKQILSIHSNEVIHTDIHSGNILVNNNDDAYLIDFDNSSIKNNGCKLSYTSDYAKDFIEHYGICKELDIFLYNLLTYYCINECNYFLARINIENKKYGAFDSIEGKKICNNMLFNDKIPTNDFLIDMIDETSIIK